MSRQGEGALSDAIRAALAHEPGLRLERNSRCAVVKGRRMVRGGLGDNGSADLVGLLLVTLHCDPACGRGGVCAGEHTGRYVALEIKLPGKIPTAADVACIMGKLSAMVRATWDAGGVVSTRLLAALPADERHVLEQEASLAAVRAHGGFAAYVDSVEAARAAIARARTGATS